MFQKYEGICVISVFFYLICVCVMISSLKRPLVLIMEPPPKQIKDFCHAVFPV